MAGPIMDKKESQLRQTISLIEWDLSRIENGEVRARKMSELELCRKELQTLLRSAN